MLSAKAYRTKMSTAWCLLILKRQFLTLESVSNTRLKDLGMHIITHSIPCGCEERNDDSGTSLPSILNLKKCVINTDMHMDQFNSAIKTFRGPKLNFIRGTITIDQSGTKLPARRLHDEPMTNELPSIFFFFSFFNILTSNISTLI